MNRRNFFAMFALALCARPKVVPPPLVTEYTFDADEARRWGETADLIFKQLKESTRRIEIIVERKKRRLCTYAMMRKIDAARDAVK